MLFKCNLVHFILYFILHVMFIDLSIYPVYY